MPASPSFQQARDFLVAHRTDWVTAYRGFEWPRPERFNWALEWFDGVLATERADQAAIDIRGTNAATLTFAELSRRSNQAANLLRRLGLKRGDRLLLMLGNVAPLWEIMLAAMKLGMVVVPASTLLTPDDLRDRVSRGRVACVVCGTDAVPKFETLSEKPVRIVADGTAEGWIAYAEVDRESADFTPDGDTKAGDEMLLYFTSGTTAQPKLVVHSHTSYPIGSLSTMYWLGLQPGDRHLNISSPGWAKHAWSCFFTPWNAGATVCVLNQPRFDAADLLDTLVEAKITTLCAPPTVWRMLIQQPMRNWKTSLREVCSAGEPLNPEVIETVEEQWGMTIRDGYGQTETTATIGNPPGQPLKHGSMGRPLPGYRIELAHEAGREGAEGEVSLSLDPRPMGLMLGYTGADGVVRPNEGPLYRTGDVATRDEEGYITYVGRADDVFKASDYRISPFELESALIEHELVAEAAVVPAPDPVRLAIPKAYLSLVAGAEPTAATAASIFAFLRQRLAPYKRVRRLEFAELPKTISGKIRRVELRKEEEARATRGERGSGEFRDEDFPEVKAG